MIFDKYRNMSIKFKTIVVYIFWKFNFRRSNFATVACEPITGSIYTMESRRSNSISTPNNIRS